MYNETCPPNSTQHVVKEGDTFWRLSQAYGVSVQNLVDANPGINADNLQIGSTLCIPANSSSPASPHTCPSRAFSYTIRAGDTFWKLSQAYGVNLQDILDANPGVNPQNLQIGSTLCIPAARAVPAPSAKVTPPSAKAVPPMKAAPPVPTAPPIPVVPQTATTPSRHFLYSIKRCDTIYGIARNFYVSVESILDENPGINPRCLQVGTYIHIPVNCCGENTWRYTVREDDTLNRIANKLNVCSSAIIAANPNIDFQHLIHCQVICIPKE